MSDIAQRGMRLSGRLRDKLRDALRAELGTGSGCLDETAACGTGGGLDGGPWQLGDALVGCIDPTAHVERIADQGLSDPWDRCPACGKRLPGGADLWDRCPACGARIAGGDA